MTSIPPQYDATDSPPSYNEVVRKFETLIGNTKSPKEIYGAASQLTNEEIYILAEKADKNIFTSEEQKEKFKLGIKKTVSSETEVTDNDLKEKAKEAREAAEKIDSIFESLVARLNGIDNMYQVPDGGYSKGMKECQKRYHCVLDDSRLHATDMAHQGKVFDDFVVKFCADSTIPIEERKEEIENWITKTSSLEVYSRDLMDRFRDLKTDIKGLFGNFAIWAQPRVEKLNTEIKDLKDKVDRLDIEIGNLTKALLGALGGVGAGFLLAISSLCLGPIPLIGGLVLAGLSLMAAVGIAIAISIKSSERAGLKNEIQNKEKELNRIMKVREELENLSNGDDPLIKAFEEGITMITGIWQTAMVDAEEIKNYLCDAEKLPKPQYMCEKLNDGVNIYKRIAVYLTEYAGGST